MTVETGSRPRELQRDADRYNHMTQEEAWRVINEYLTIIPNNKSVWKIAGFRKMKVASRVPGMPDWMAVLINPNIPINVPPTGHAPGPGVTRPTDFRYAVEHRITLPDNREAMLYVNGAEDEAMTSQPPHTHGGGEDELGMFEHYFVFGEVYIGEGENRRLMNSYELVPPHTEHGLQVAKGGKGFVIILLENIKNIPNNKIHTPRLQAA